MKAVYEVVRNPDHGPVRVYRVWGNHASGARAPSPPLYHHCARLPDTDVIVPVAVWRTMDAGAHGREGAEPGLAFSGGNHSSQMNHEGGRRQVSAERDPGACKATDELFTADRRQIFGVLLSSPGHRYGSEINVRPFDAGVYRCLMSLDAHRQVTGAAPVEDWHVD